MREINLELYELIEFLLDGIRPYIESSRKQLSSTQQDWYSEFVELFASLGPLIEGYLIEKRNEESRLLWFLVEFTQTSDEAVDIMMDYLPISTVMIDYL